MAKKTHPHKRSSVRKAAKCKPSDEASRTYRSRTKIALSVIASALFVTASLAYWKAPSDEVAEVIAPASVTSEAANKSPVKDVSTLSEKELANIPSEAYAPRPPSAAGYNAHSGALPPDALPPGVVLPGLMHSGRPTAQGYGMYDGVRQQFTGKERDNETGLDYFGARYYSSAQGRFTSVDPSRKAIDVRNPQSWNGYSYALNNPMAYVDNNGKWPTSIHERIVDLALPGLSNAERQVIKQASYRIDHERGSQSPDNAYKHGMRAPNESVDEATQATSGWIEDWKRTAQKSADKNTVLTAFGFAFHAVSDMTSPSHEGFQVWRGIVDSTIVLRSGLHALDESLGFNVYRQGLAVGATQRLYEDTFGSGALKRATGGIEFGSENDPTIQQIHKMSDLTGASQAEEGLALYEYRLGLSTGWDFNYNDPRHPHREIRR